MKKTVALVAVAISALMVGTSSLPAAEESESSTRPPTNLKKVGDHWTPWESPTPKAEDYLIQKGDTLWDLSEAWLADPHLWPQIWDLNRYILDSHWIYPGDPLVKPAAPTVVPPEGPPAGVETSETGPGAESEAPAAPAETPEAPPTPAPLAMVPVADQGDLYCSGAIEADRQPSPSKIVGLDFERIVPSDMDKAIAGDGEIVYLNQGRSQGLSAGAELAVVRDERPVTHPATGQNLGRMVRRMGKLRVLCAQENTATAVVTLSCEDLRVGDEVVPWKDIRSPMVTSLPRCDRCETEPSGGPLGFVVDAKDNLGMVGKGNVIFTDLGTATGVHPGSVLTIFRDNGDLPRIVLGRAVVLEVGDSASSAKVVEATRDVVLGDRAEELR